MASWGVKRAELSTATKVNKTAQCIGFGTLPQFAIYHVGSSYYFIMEWFEKRARELQQKEIESLHQEIADRETAYFDEIRKAGFDNTHDYEDWVMGKFLKRIGICVLIVIVLIVWWWI